MSAPDTRPAILVVDDAEDTLRVIARIFSTKNWDVTTCNSGARAIELTAERWFDLILLDLEMPTLGGLGVARKLRAREIPLGPRVAIVALTAQTAVSYRANALEAGFDGFLTKPFRMAELIGAVEKYLAAASAG